MIVYEYTLDMKSSLENPDQSEWVTTYLCESKRISSPKESLPNLSVLIVIWYVMVVLVVTTHTVLIGGSSDVPG